jgi:sterol desaturase/sphingolipid hydroxylase (fatty acid hydroxylase superfamily)
VVVVGTFLGWGPAVGVLLGFALFTPLERRYRRHDWPIRRPQLRTDILHFLFTGVLNTACLVVGIGVVWLALHWFEIGATRAAWLALPTWAKAIGGLVLFEIFGYWYHRWSHEVPLLWRFHSVHHSSEHLDWLAGPRLHPLEGFFAAFVVAPPFILLGVRPLEVTALSVITTIWAILIHSNVSWRMRWLDGIVGTPEYHHWHHSSHPEAWDRNYSGLMPVLDRIFGTYYQPKDRRPEAYGIEGGIPDGWWRQMLFPFREGRRRARLAGRRAGG